MKFHIVRNGETLKDILFIYNLTPDEIKEQNRHIRVWDKLIPGTKLKIPSITEAVEQDVSEMEPFVEDYYPKLNHDIYAQEEPIIKEDYSSEEEQLIDEDLKGQDKVELVVKLKEDKKETSKALKENKNLPPELLKVQEEQQDILINPIQNLSNQMPMNYYPYYLGYYNNVRYIPYSTVYYPIYYKKRS